jgi:NADH-quinone oxidoreductase subunit M
MDLISAMTFLPLVGVIVIVLFQKLSDRAVRLTAFMASILPLFFTLKLLAGFTAGSGIQFEKTTPWIEALNVHYHVGVDGLSIAMVLLVSILAPITILASYRWMALPRFANAGIRTFFSLLLLEQTALYGAFTALNFFHWFIFWEASLVPMFFLIKLYGNEERTEASYQFFVYTFIGSVAMLLGMQFIYLATGTWSFTDLASMAHNITASGESEFVVKIKIFSSTLGIPFMIKYAVTFLFALVFFGFAFKVPLWPFHTWLPISYTHAPTAGSMILTGLMSKMGLYGFLRVVFPLFGSTIAQYSNILLTLAVFTIIFGALAALAQRDVKTIIAYSSISHLGYCLFGIFAAAGIGAINEKALAINGVIIMMFAHGLSGAGLFYFAGVLEQRAQSRQLKDFGGLRKAVPVMSGLFGITMFASLGLPGLAGFVGEYMIFQGSFPLVTALPSISILGFSIPLAIILMSVAVFGILLTALYLLRFTTNVFFGPQVEKWAGMPDLTQREILVSAILIALMFWVGVSPGPLVDLSNASVLHLLGVTR